MISSTIDKIMKGHDAVIAAWGACKQSRAVAFQGNKHIVESMKKFGVKSSFAKHH
jgi:hypothetical protein